MTQDVAMVPAGSDGHQRSASTQACAYDSEFYMDQTTASTQCDIEDSDSTDDTIIDESALAEDPGNDETSENQNGEPVNSLD